jgi:soluble lytic murein transglycosylase
MPRTIANGEKYAKKPSDFIRTAFFIIPYLLKSLAMKKKTIILFGAAVLCAACLICLNSKTGVFSGTPYENLIIKYSSHYGVDTLLVRSLIEKESKSNPNALSSKGAIGLMQIMPKTAAEIAGRLSISLDENSLKDPEINIMFGIFYLKQLLSYYDGNLILALAAYNAGIGNVDLWKTQNPQVSSKISEIPFKETRRYVKGILFAYKVYRMLK